MGGNLGSCGGKDEDPRYLNGLLKRLESTKELKRSQRADAYAWLAERFARAQRTEPAKAALGKALDITLKMRGLSRSSAEEAVAKVALLMGDRSTWQRVLGTAGNKKALRIALAAAALKLPQDREIAVELAKAAVRATTRPTRETVELARLLHGLGDKRQAKKLLDRTIRAYLKDANPNYPEDGAVLVSGDAEHVVYRLAVDELHRQGHLAAARRAATSMGDQDKVGFEGMRLLGLVRKGDMKQAARLVKGLKPDLRKSTLDIALGDLIEAGFCRPAMAWLPSVDTNTFSLVHFYYLVRNCVSASPKEVEQSIQKWLQPTKQQPRDHHPSLLVEVQAAAGRIDQALVLMNKVSAPDQLSDCIVALSRQLQARKLPLDPIQKRRLDAIVNRVAR